MRIFLHVVAAVFIMVVFPHESQISDVTLRQADGRISDAGSESYYYSTH